MKKAIKKAGLTGFLLLLLLFVTSLCAPPFVQGSWENDNSNTRGITKAEVIFHCQDQILNGVPCCPVGPAYYIQLYGACTPSDCEWGKVPAQRVGNGFLYATYDHGFAKRYVYLRESNYRPGKLWVFVYTDFVSPSRRDYSMHNWFDKK